MIHLDLITQLPDYVALLIKETFLAQTHCPLSFYNWKSKMIQLPSASLNWAEFSPRQGLWRLDAFCADTSLEGNCLISMKSVFLGSGVISSIWQTTH